MPLAALGASLRAGRLVPGGRGAAWSAAALAAILAFFAVLALALALAAGRLAAEWGGAAGGGATLQVIADEAAVEAQARAALEVLRTTEGVRTVRVVEVEEQRALIAPWLGTDVPVDTLPMPLMIEVAVERGGLDVEALTERLADEAPGAVFDDHSAWRLPLVATAERLRLFALASVALLLGGLALALRLAAGAALAANADAIRTLRAVGARDDFIAMALVRRFGAGAGLGAALGAGAGMALAGALPAGSEAGFFLVGIGLAGWQWLLPLAVPLAAVGIAVAVTLSTARRALRRAG